METQKKKNGCLKMGLIISGALFALFVALMIILSAIGSNHYSNTSKNEPVAKIEDKQENDSILKEKLEIVEVELNKMKSLFNTRYDEFEQITWIEHKNIPKYANSKGFYTYLGIKDNRVWQRLVIRYFGDDWLFIQKIIVKADESTFEIVPNKVERDNNTNVWEWIDVTPTKTEIAMIGCIVPAAETKVRFSGRQYYKDWTLTQKEIKGLRDTQVYFNLLQEKQRLEKDLL